MLSRLLPAVSADIDLDSLAVRLYRDIYSRLESDAGDAASVEVVDNSSGGNYYIAPVNNHRFVISDCLIHSRSGVIGAFEPIKHHFPL